jgi:soluble cytochrome b562
MLYFHLIGIKEKEGHQYQLDILIGGGELSMIKEFLEDWGIVIVSLDEYEKPIEEFGKIRMIIPFKESDFSVITFSDTLEKSIRYVFALGLHPKHVEIADNSMTDEEIAALVEKIAKEYEQQQKQWTQQQTLLQQKEIKKYENKDIKHALKVINSNIDRIDQLLFIGRGILSSEEMKTLTDISNELKKIRLGTNFNRMAELLLDAQSHITASEDLVLKALDDKKFLIDRNSIITNIDVISQYASLIRAQEKFVLKKPLSTKESLYLTGKH